MMRRFQLDEEAGIETDSLEYSREFRNFWKAETDAATELRTERVAALEVVDRCREVVDALRTRYAENSDAAYFVRQIVAALDGAPEPEWEYRVTLKNGTELARGTLDEVRRFKTIDIERRRLAGPWLPVEGESK